MDEETRKYENNIGDKLIEEFLKNDDAKMNYGCIPLTRVSFDIIKMHEKIITFCIIYIALLSSSNIISDI